MTHKSETSKHRELFLPYLPPCNLVDVGFGGDKIVPWAIGLEKTAGVMAHVGEQPVQLDFDCRSLPFKDGTMDAFYSAHVLEDLPYSGQAAALYEWKRCLRRGGVIALLLPDQQRYLAHCHATGQDINLAHVEQDMSLASFKSKVWPSIRGDMVLVEAHDLGDYSWMFVAKKL